MKYLLVCRTVVSFLCTLPLIALAASCLYNSTPLALYDSYGYIIDAGNCSVVECSESLCSYSGNITIAYKKHNSYVEDIVLPQHSCGHDCCAQLASLEQHIFVLLDANATAVVYWTAHPRALNFSLLVSGVIMVIVWIATATCTVALGLHSLIDDRTPLAKLQSVY